MSSARSKKRVLFVCRENRVRSLTAEQVYRGRQDLEVRSAGIAEYAAVPLTPELFEWADLVFVFSKEQQRIVEARFGNRLGSRRLVCLPLPDRFDYKSPKLVSKLTGRLTPYLGAPVDDRWDSAGTPPAPRVADNPAVSPDRDTPSLGRRVSSLLNALPFGAKALSAAISSP